jgi:hypothetical protein
VRIAAALIGACISGVATAAEIQHARVAVVVGIDRPNPDVPALKNGEMDAIALAQSFNGSAGYGRVFTLYAAAATADAMLSTASQALAATADDGTLVFVYVGHGAGGDFGEPAFMTAGAQLSDPSGTGLSVERLAEVLRPRTPEQSIVVSLDAAHEGDVDGVALIGPSAEDWPNVPEWGLALTTPNARGLTAEAGRLLPALNEAISGKGDENFDGHVTISELARYVGREMSDGAGSLLHTAGSVAANLTVSDAGQERPVEPVVPAVPAVPAVPVVPDSLLVAPVVADSTPFRLRPVPVVVVSVGAVSGLASMALYFSRRGDCVEYAGSLRCGEAGTGYEAYRTTQHALGWVGGVLVASGIGMSVLAGPTQTSVVFSGRF